MKLKLHHEKLKVVTNQQQAQLKDQQQKHINTIMYIQKQVRNVSAANNVIADMCVRAKDIICVQSVIKRILVNKMTQEGTHTFIKNEQSDLKYEQYVLIYIEHKNSNLPIKWLKSFSRILLIICEVEILTSLTLFRFNKINNIKQTSQLNQSSTAYLLKQLFNQNITIDNSYITGNRLLGLLTSAATGGTLIQSSFTSSNIIADSLCQTFQGGIIGDTGGTDLLSLFSNIVFNISLFSNNTNIWSISGGLIGDTHASPCIIQYSIIKSSYIQSYGTGVRYASSGGVIACVYDSTTTIQDVQVINTNIKAASSTSHVLCAGVISQISNQRITVSNTKVIQVYIIATGITYDAGIVFSNNGSSTFTLSGSSTGGTNSINNSIKMNCANIIAFSNQDGC
ncbi:Hypothetical_protein [Hexamita inflata]|uniref:Hypothetical_protein n=1 Tax=Hexamita inflata TaxID=28002 RepID=A0AA86P844_9EUKA|nr:Hypothetical protein HINF_LOCUS19192 [Hexamita inflata]